MEVATFALLTVRYRSAEEAIAFVMQPEYGFYRHPFIGIVQKFELADSSESLKDGNDLEKGTPRE